MKLLSTQKHKRNPIVELKDCLIKNRFQVEVHHKSRFEFNTGSLFKL